jgi:hypothetical protein
MSGPINVAAQAINSECASLHGIAILSGASFFAISSSY